MRQHVLVIPPSLIKDPRIADYRQVVRMHDDREVDRVLAALDNTQPVDYLWVDSGKNLSEIGISDAWDRKRIIVSATGAGDLTKVLARAAEMRKGNLSFFFTASSEETCTQAQMLASLEIHAGIILPADTVDWEQLLDLLCYALFTKCRRGSIEPFDYLLANITREDSVDFADVLLDNPQKFLHLAEGLNVALSRDESDRKEYVGSGETFLAGIESAPPYIERINAWTGFFAESSDCSCCRSWRICQGKFSAQADKENTCQNLFAQILNARAEMDGKV